MKVSVIAPVKNEAQFIGYSVMAVLPYVHEIIYSCARSTDGTDEILKYIQRTHAGGKLVLLKGIKYDFNPKDMEAYNKAFNDCIDAATGDAVWFLHPDMIVTNPEAIQNIPADRFAWWTNLTSYAKDMDTVITKGRASRWKNIHSKQLGLHYFGAYGSDNEDFYHSDITGDTYRHYGENFDMYPFEVGNSGVMINHYCECKPYHRRLEKMKACLSTQTGGLPDEDIERLALEHPRVTLDKTSSRFGDFVFEPAQDKRPAVFDKYKSEFEAFTYDRT